jgi:hypothetical protein
VVIEALGAWGLALDAGVLRPRLRERPDKPIPSFAPFLRYIRAFAPERYRSLEPDVAALLRVGRDDEIMIEALKTLDRWAHVLTPRRGPLADGSGATGPGGDSGLHDETPGSLKL